LSQLKNISPPWKFEIRLFRHFSKLEIAYFIGKILSISRELNFTPNTLGSYGLIVEQMNASTRVFRRGLSFKFFLILKKIIVLRLKYRRRRVASENGIKRVEMIGMRVRLLPILVVLNRKKKNRKF